ncbi:hypothetical protein BD410DRAFT_840890 [Rickenella mellea]|uniref:Uncharacterized protein n=1 Tax=Rickenella mellea TaxID=50990 RepID=A0A4Y7Q2A1_9AGAM|nr:hypothetical protein BD410DRAFT_840890 [Rickenella mellea]
MAHETLGESVHLGAWIDLDLTVNHLTSGDEFPTPPETRLHFRILDPAVLTQSKPESSKELFHSGATIKADERTQEPSIIWDEPPHYSFENLQENQTIRIFLTVGKKADRQAEFHVTTHMITSLRIATKVNIVCANNIAGKPTLNVTLTKFDRRGVSVKFQKAVGGSKPMIGMFKFRADICGAPKISPQKIFLLSGMTYESKEIELPNNAK